MLFWCNLKHFYEINEKSVYNFRKLQKCLQLGTVCIQEIHGDSGTRRRTMLGFLTEGARDVANNLTWSPCCFLGGR